MNIERRSEEAAGKIAEKIAEKEAEKEAGKIAEKKAKWETAKKKQVLLWQLGFF